MSTTVEPTTTPAAPAAPAPAAPVDDPGAAFIEHVTAKYAALDAKNVRREDGLDDEDEEHEKDDARDDDATDEHSDADTVADHPKKPGAADPDDDSTDDDDADHPEETSAESDDATTADDDEKDEKDAVSDATKAALERHGGIPKLDDVPQKYRPLIENKLRHIDAAFTRAQSEATAFRAQRTEFEADKRFREANPDLVITEMLQADPDLIEKVQERLDKLVDPDQAAAFRIVVKETKRELRDAITAEDTKAEEERSVADRVEARVNEVETYIRRLSAKAGMPSRFAEMAVAHHITTLKRELTNAEIEQVVSTEAREYTKSLRQTNRETSKHVVQQRSANRAARSPADKRTASAVSPRPATAGAVKVDHNSEESRIAAMMNTARRVLPGKRDK